MANIVYTRDNYFMYYASNENGHYLYLETKDGSDHALIRILDTSTEVYPIWVKFVSEGLTPEDFIYESPAWSTRNFRDGMIDWYLLEGYHDMLNIYSGKWLWERGTK